MAVTPETRRWEELFAARTRGDVGEGIAFADFVRNDSAGPAPATQPSANDVAVLQLTSGTTRSPRVCIWRQEQLLSSLDGAARAINLQRSDICFSWLPLYHDMGLVNAFLLSLTQGIPLALLSPQDFVRRPCLWMQGISETRATVFLTTHYLDEAEDADRICILDKGKITQVSATQLTLKEQKGVIQVMRLACSAQNPFGSATER